METSVFPDDIWRMIIPLLDYPSAHYTMPLVCQRFYSLLLPKLPSPLSRTSRSKSHAPGCCTLCKTKSCPFDAPPSPDSPRYTLHPKLRGRFEIAHSRGGNATNNGVVALVRKPHAESFDTMKPDDAAAAMIGARWGWGDFKSGVHYESAVTPSVSKVVVEMGSETVEVYPSSSLSSHSSEYDSDDDEEEDEQTTVLVRDVLAAEADYTSSSLEEKRASFALYKANITNGFVRGVSATGTVLPGCGSYNPRGTIRTTRENYERLKAEYIDPEERMYVAFDEWRAKRSRERKRTSSWGIGWGQFVEEVYGVWAKDESCVSL